jgi:hypothetical protein
MRASDLDGKAGWTVEELRRRYDRYCHLFNVDPRPLPSGDDWPSRRGLVVSFMDAFIQGMKEGDIACAEIGIELIEQDAGFAFGRIMKANAARALARCALTEDQKERIRARVVEMLIRGFMPHEFRDYARLLRRIGLAGHRERLERTFDPADPWAAWYVRYLTSEHPGPKPE